MAKFTILLAVASAVNAHMALFSPTPYGSTQPYNTSPLDASGSDYPCHNDFTFNGITNITAGEDLQMSFYGQAVHNGGTCQLTITLDETPTKTSVFKIIKVFEGDCPVVSPATLPYSIPKSVPNGRVTLGWLWNNNLGNREIYMGCAPLTIFGGADSKDEFESLPNQYVVNMPPESCGVPASSDLTIPNPGQVVIKAAQLTAASATGPSCAASAAAQTQGVERAGDGSGSCTNVTTSTGNDPSSVTQLPIIATSSSAVTPYANPVPVHTTSATSTVTPTYILSPSDNMTSSPASSTATPTSSSGQSVPDSNSSSSGGSTTCTEDGGVVCNGPTLFGLCNGGSVVWQSVAPGTSCQNGQITKRSALRITRRRRSILFNDM